MSADDIEAINRYIQSTTAKTAAATADKSSWVNWYNGLNFFTKVLDSTTQDASAKRDRFNIDNGTPPIPSVPLTAEEAEYFKNIPVVDVSNMTAEQAQKAVWTAPPGAAPQPVSLTVARTTISQTKGSKGENVKEWQRIVGGVPVDGIFGATTTTATKAWQTAHNLKADGIVGPLTWGAAYGDLPKLNPEVPSVSTPASKAAATGPAKSGVTYPISYTTPTTPVTPKTTTSTVKTVPTTPKTQTDVVGPGGVQQMGMFSFFTNLATWAKVALAVAVGGGVVYGIKYDIDRKKQLKGK